MNQSLLVGLFFCPVKTFKKIAQNDISKDKFWIITVFGFLLGTTKIVSDQNFSFKVSFLVKVLITGASGVLFAYIVIGLFSAALYFTGKWLDGKANRLEIENTISYAYVNLIMVYLISILVFLTYRPEDLFFKFDLSNFYNRSLFFYNAGIFFYYAFLGYFFALLLIAIYSVQKFKWWKAILNLIFSSLLITIPFFIFPVILYLMFF